MIFVNQPLVHYCIEGGVSRSRPTDKLDFLTRWTREVNLRNIQDAYQRLSDARLVGAPKPILKLCRKTIRHHKAMVRLAESAGATRELALLLAITTGGRALELLKHYIKFRLPIGRKTFSD